MKVQYTTFNNRKHAVRIYEVDRYWHKSTDIDREISKITKFVKSATKEKLFISSWVDVENVIDSWIAENNPTEFYADWKSTFTEGNITIFFKKGSDNVL
jgi:hypothetical protein